MARGASQQVAALSERFEQTGDVSVLLRAAHHAFTAVNLVPDGHPDQVTHLAHLASVLGTLAEVTGDQDALERAVRIGRETVAVASPDDSGRAMYLSNLGGVLTRLFLSTGDDEALAEAVAVGRTAVATAAADDPDRAMYLSNLALTLMAVFRDTDDVEAVTEAVAVGREAAHAMAGDDPRRFMCLTNLAIALRHLFDCTRAEATLHEAVSVGRAAVDATSEGQPNRAGALSGLSNALLVLYESAGSIQVLEEAVRVGRAAVAACPADHPARLTLLSNLGITLSRLFERTGDAAAVAEAVLVGRAAVTACPDGHPDRAMYLNNLGGFLTRLFQRTNRAPVLREAAQLERAAADLMPEGHAHRTRYLAGLGTVLRTLFETTQDAGALDEAVRVERAAAAAMRDDRQDKAVLLSNLGLTLRLVSEARGDTAALAEAIAAGRAAVAMTPDEHPDLSMFLLTLGMSLLSAFERAGDTAALAQAREALARAAALPAAPVQMRIEAGQTRARADSLAGDHLAAMAAMEAVIGLLPRLAPRELRRADREHRLGEVAGIGAQGAAAALSAGRPERAVELLEQARGLLLAETMGVRGEPARLRELAPDLLADFERSRDVMAMADATEPPSFADPGPPNPWFSDEEAKVQLPELSPLAVQRREAGLAWEALLSDIRSRPGLADFLAPPPVGRLRECASGGAIVIVSTDRFRCDALILTDDPEHPVRHVPLPGLSQQAAYEQVDRLLTARLAASGDDRAARSAAQAEIHEILRWLWDTTAEPILTALGYATTSDAGQWPHLWWCPVGAMTYLPLHAAGHHQEAAEGRAHPRTVLDRVISSYTATIRALAYARRPAPAAGPRPALIVAMPETQDTADLPGVRAELSAMTQLLPGATVLQGPDASRRAVLDALPEHSIAHFACHGLSDWDDPGGSQLVLYDYDVRPLTVTAISRLQLTRADLAYLSACSTTDTSPTLADEAVHITAAFQLAGYRNVIGTLWPIADRAARVAAQSVYGQLTRQGTTDPDTTQTAVALHLAIHRLRARSAQLPSHWAGHIHMGGNPLAPDRHRGSSHEAADGGAANGGAGNGGAANGGDA
jgi:CHAT domain-containing protein